MADVSTPGGTSTTRGLDVPGRAPSFAGRVASGRDDDRCATQHVGECGPRPRDTTRHRHFGAVQNDPVGNTETGTKKPEWEHGIQEHQVDVVLRDAPAHPGHDVRRREVEDRVGHALDMDPERLLFGVECRCVGVRGSREHDEGVRIEALPQLPEVVLDPPYLGGKSFVTSR